MRRDHLRDISIFCLICYWWLSCWLITGTRGQQQSAAVPSWYPYYFGTYPYSSYYDSSSSYYGESYTGKNVPLNESMPWFKEPLWGVTYVPFRRSTNCSSITEKDIEDDLKNITRLTHLIYVPEMYCQFADVIVRTAGALGNKLVLGLSMRTKSEFERQYSQLEQILRGSNNLSHLSAISVGYNDLEKYQDDTKYVVDSLKRVKMLVLNSTNPRTNVTASSLQYNLLFDLPWTPYLDAYMASVNVEADRSYYSALRRITDTFNNIKKISLRIDDHVKRIYVTGAGWPSAGRGAPPSRPDASRRGTMVNASSSDVIVGNATDQAEFIVNLVCGAHKRTGIRYFYHYAFDPAWQYPNASDQRANWGLIDVDRRALKPALVSALTPKCSAADLAEDEGGGEETNASKKRAARAIGIGAGLGLVALFVVLLVAIVIFYRRKKEADKQRMQLSARHMSTTSSDAVSSTPIYKNKDEYIGMVDAALYADLKNMVDPKYIIKVDELDFGEVIGEGHFGIVQRARLTKGDQRGVDVAAKRLHDGATNVRQFILEGLRMENLHHPNVLHLIGISFLNQMPMIILPFMEKDNLLTFVKDSKNDLTLRRILDFCIQIADGMQYLHGMKLVHRDLAARNCMLDSSLAVRIADFGLCRDISETDSYQATRTFELPVRWMAPETILKLEWTNKSDVWSYGVVLWELLTRGKQPYKDILLIELRMFLENGGRLTKPRSCPDIIYDFMKTCWHRNPDERPEFSVLRHTLSSLIEAVDVGHVVDAAAYYNAITIIESESTSNGSSSNSGLDSGTSSL